MVEQLISILDNQEHLRALKIVLRGGEGEPLQVGSNLTEAQQGVAQDTAQKLATRLGKPLTRTNAGPETI